MSSQSQEERQKHMEQNKLLQQAVDACWAQSVRLSDGRRVPSVPSLVHGNPQQAFHDAMWVWVKIRPWGDRRF